MIDDTNTIINYGKENNACDNVLNLWLSFINYLILLFLVSPCVPYLESRLIGTSKIPKYLRKIFVDSRKITAISKSKAFSEMLRNIDHTQRHKNDKLGTLLVKVKK